MKTTNVPINICASSDRALLAVEAGVPIADAMETLQSVLSSASAIAYQVTCSQGAQSEALGYACVEMLAIASALVHACVTELESGRGGVQ